MDDLKRNGSGYYDPTAYKAIRKLQNGGVSNMNIRKGEIWEVEHGKDSKLALVLSHRGSYCTVLLLNDEPRETRDIRLNARGMKYTESGMVSYKFCDAFVDFIRTTTDEEFDDVMNKVSESLGLISGSDDSQIDELKMKLEGAERKTNELEAILALSEAENEKLKNIIGNQPAHDFDPAEVIVLKTERDLYKQQYEKMLERLIGA